MTINAYQQYKETVEEDFNMLCQLKQGHDWMDISVIICHINKFCDELSVIDVKEVVHISSFPLL